MSPGTQEALLDAAYLDFDLCISADGGRYFAKVIDSPAGPSKTVPLRTPFPDQSRAELMLRLENAILRTRGQHRGPVSKEEMVLREFGAEVFRIVFQEAAEVAAKFAVSLSLVQQRRGEVEGLRVKLRVEPPELALLPWEYVYDNDSAKEYLCLRFRSPLVRFLELPDVPAAWKVEGALNILGMIANPGGEWGKLDSENERHRIDEAIGPLQRKGLVNFRWVSGETSNNLFDAMHQMPWHVFHFIGHGGIYERDGNGSYDDRSDGFIVLADGRGGAQRVSADDLSLMLQGDGSLKLAVLNCCESAKGESTSAFSSPGAALVKSGIPAVVAMQFPITNDAAIQFAGGFYNSIVAGYPIEKALTAARVSMRLQSDVEWGIPVLFTRSPTGRLFELSPGGSGTVEEPAAGARRGTASPGTGTGARQLNARQELRRLFANVPAVSSPRGGTLPPHWIRR